MLRTTSIVAALALLAGVSACSHNRTDADISSAVKQNLAVDRLPDTIMVTTNDGDVTLAGILADVNTKDRAGVAASRVKGVQQVVNALRPTTMAGDMPKAANPPAAPRPPMPAAPEGFPNPPQNVPNDVPANPPAAGAPNSAPIPDPR